MKPKLLLILFLAVGAAGLSDNGLTQSAVNRLHPAVAGCPICDLWLQYEGVILNAKQEVGPLHNGILYFYHSREPSVIEPLIRFAHERVRLEEQLQSDEEFREQLGVRCGHGRMASLGIDLEVSTSARGIFALVTSENRKTLTRLRTQAERAVWGKIPVWF